MNIATLRTEGSDAALEALGELLDLKVDAVWRKGDTRRRGGVNVQSGFNACVADAANPTALVAEIRGFLIKCLTLDAVLHSSELSAQLDVGISVGGSAQFSASVVFPAEDLGLCSKLGVVLSISAYPCSDEEG
jgi:hypothetical protein